MQGGLEAGLMAYLWVLCRVSEEHCGVAHLNAVEQQRGPPKGGCWLLHCVGIRLLHFVLAASVYCCDMPAP